MLKLPKPLITEFRKLGIIEKSIFPIPQKIYVYVDQTKAIDPLNAMRTMPPDDCRLIIDY